MENRAAQLLHRLLFDAGHVVFLTETEPETETEVFWPKNRNRNRALKTEVLGFYKN